VKLAAIVRPSATVTMEGAGIGVEELRAAVLQQQPADHELAQLLVHSGRVDGNLVGTGVFRAMTTHALEALVPADHIELSARVVDQPA